ncbi:MAG: hypothetical protein WD738_02460 [Pirellulales bacterium]
MEPAQRVNDTRAESGGIRKLSARHLILYTDVPANPQIDRLPHIFDQAVPQWAKYFGVPDAKTDNWRAQAYLIGDRRRFEALGMMPAGHDEFINGISIGSELWLYDQPTDYYRRHLLLHEGTHVFMNAFLGGCGPGWYMEGTAELLATHRLDEQTGLVTLRIMPRDRAEVPMLGRIKLIRDACDGGHALAFPAVMQIDNRQQLGNEAYAWCWAAAKFLDSHPRYLRRFRNLQQHVLDNKFNDVVRREYEQDWDEVNAEWQAFVATLEHGYDFERMAIGFQRGQPLGAAPQRMSIAADRGWQSSGVWLEAGRPYRVNASGRYQIASEEKDGVTQPWPCEPGGVTIEYHNGNPLGMLLGAIDTSFADPMAIGVGSTIGPMTSGTLYLRVNDSPARLGDNHGTLMVTIEEVRKAK